MGHENLVIHFRAKKTIFKIAFQDRDSSILSSMSKHSFGIGEDSSFCEFHCTSRRVRVRKVLCSL